MEKQTLQCGSLCIENPYGKTPSWKENHPQNTPAQFINLNQPHTWIPLSHTIRIKTQVPQK